MKNWFSQLKYKDILKNLIIVILLLSNILLIRKLVMHEENLNSYYEALMNEIAFELKYQIKALEGFKQNPDSLLEAEGSFYNGDMAGLSEELGEAANAMRTLSFVESDIGNPARATGDVAFALEKFRQIGFPSDVFSERGFLIYIERSLDKLREWQAIMEKGLTPIDTMLELNEAAEYSMYDGWSSNHDIAYMK